MFFPRNAIFVATARVTDTGIRHLVAQRKPETSGSLFLDTGLFTS